MSTRSFTSHAPSSSSARRAESSRHITSESISAHIAAFEAAGGEVEVLETTTVLKRIQAEPAASKPKA